MAAKTLLKGGTVLTLGARTPNFVEGDVLIEGDRISEVGTGLRARGAEEIDASQSIVMPGFVDTHRHGWKSLFRNLGLRGSDAGSPVPSELYGLHYRPEDAYAATFIGLLGAAEAGITTVVDWSDILVDDDYTEAVLQAHSEAGVRTVLVYAGAPWRDGGSDPEPSVRRLAAGESGTQGPLTVLAFGPGEPRREELDSVNAQWQLARELGLRIHTHAGVGHESRGVVSSLGERGLLGEDVTLVHCSHLDGADLDSIKARRVAVSLAPASEMAGGLGSPPLQELIDRDIRPGLGVDSEGLAPGDMFAQMRAANSIQHATHFDLKLAGKGGLPNLLSTREVIKYATFDGARVAGLGEVTGSIEPGKQADIIVLRTDRPNIHPINDPIGAVVWGMDTSNLAWVFVAGRAVMAEGSLTADVDNARRLAVDSQRRVGEAAGILVGAGDSP